MVAVADLSRRGDLRGAFRTAIATESEEVRVNSSPSSRCAPALVAVLACAVAGAGGAVDPQGPPPPGSPDLPAYYARVLPKIKARASAGYADAEFVLGHLYLNGLGVAADPTEGVKWLERAAAKGEKLAALELGALFAGGETVPRDYVAAVRWFHIAAHQGLPDAAFNLGTFYQRGLGVDSDPLLALAWMSAAVRYLPAAAPATRRGEFTAARDAIAATLTAEQIAAAPRLTSAEAPLYSCVVRNSSELAKRGSADYPRGLIQLARQGVVTLRVRVDPTGHIVESVIEGSTGYAPLDAATVRLLAYADVQPRVIDGQVVTAWTMTKWAWAVTEDRTNRPAPR